MAGITVLVRAVFCKEDFRVSLLLHEDANTLLQAVGFVLNVPPESIRLGIETVPSLASRLYVYVGVMQPIPTALNGRTARDLAERLAYRCRFLREEVPFYLTLTSAGRKKGSYAFEPLPQPQLTSTSPDA